MMHDRLPAAALRVSGDLPAVHGKVRPVHREAGHAQGGRDRVEHESERVSYIEELRPDTKRQRHGIVQAPAPEDDRSAAREAAYHLDAVGAARLLMHTIGRGTVPAEHDDGAGGVPAAKPAGSTAFGGEEELPVSGELIFGGRIAAGVSKA